MDSESRAEAPETSNGGRFNKEAVQLAIYGSPVGDKGRSVAPALLLLTDEAGVVEPRAGGVHAMVTQMLARSVVWTAQGLDELEDGQWIVRQRTYTGLRVTWTEQARRWGDEALAARAAAKSGGGSGGGGGKNDGEKAEPTAAVRSSGTRRRTPIPDSADANVAKAPTFVATSSNRLERPGLAKARAQHEEELLATGGAS